MKVKFTIAVVASHDPKTSIRVISKLQKSDDSTIYTFPPDLQTISVHPELTSIPIIAKALQQLKQRGSYRNLVVTLKEEISEKYFDSEGNPCFKDIYLEELIPNLQTPVNTTPQSELKTVTPRSLAKDMVLEKFTGKSQDVHSWITQFEAECARMKALPQQYAEILRLFLEGCATNDWFQIQLKSITLSADWSDWKNQFTEDFSQKGWSNILSALNYSYKNGSLSDYALRKFRLLLEADPSLTAISRVNLTVVSLPARVRNRIDRCEVETESSLIAKLQALEYMVTPYSRSPGNSFRASSNTPVSGTTAKPEKSCNGCKTRNRKYNNHTDAECGFNPANKNKQIESAISTRPIKVTNNIELEKLLNDNVPEPKN